LVELLVCLAVLAVTLSLVIPGFSLVLASTTLQAEADRFMSALNRARSEAVVRRQAVSLCPSDMIYSGLPTCDGSYDNGWIIFSNPGRDLSFDAGEDELVAVFQGLPAQYSWTDRSGQRNSEDVITYLPDGSSRRSLTHLFCASSVPGLQPLSIVINTVGRPRLARGEGTCPQA
jgi:type IV fimbrial biogenesis protein FimT